MLKIATLNSRNYPNDLHMQCITDVRNLTQSNNPVALGVGNQYDDFVLWYASASLLLRAALLN
jgi:hypothetical protein